jgi:4-hydroxybenzoate polyprenyltransferase
MIISIIKLIRPMQWIKNVFVFSGLLFDVAWRDAIMVNRALLAFVAFSFVASSIYVLNDLADKEEDRNHPIKRNRPIASGAVKPSVAVFVGILLLVAGFGIGFASSPLVAIILGIYFVLNVFYSAGLKRVVIRDVFIIAAGFLLRILAGTIGIGMEPSEWLFLCSLCLTLFLGFGKRRAELRDQEMLLSDGQALPSRHVLRDYSPIVLDTMMAVVAACTFVTYGLFTMSEETVAQHGTSALVYTLPFVMYAMFRYFYSLHQRNKGGDPATDLVRDPHVVVSGVCWLITTYMIIR